MGVPDEEESREAPDEAGEKAVLVGDAWEDSEASKEGLVVAAWEATAE